jgi:acetyl-CoA carboxylase, biotin carboxylase subunit
MFDRILVANRGEIALRIIRACKEMGISSVAVFSDADAESLHVKHADESVNIGKPLSKRSYLNHEIIIAAARQTNAEAVHPGYGFLAESESFARACRESGLVFIGPSSETIARAGDKSAAREEVRKLGVPVIPGSRQVIGSLAESLEPAREIGYPVMIKAAGGGGGRGIRIVLDESGLEEGLRIASAEAGAAFGNPDVYLEKFLERPRHIEIQIIGDSQGNFVHLGERECSIQKRYQKLIEESPSPFVDQELRARMGETAIKVARATGYVNAGTVEFLVDENKNFYFMELNSRIQVEHPVTEMVTGTDLVREQIRVAAGERLEFTQNDITSNGWSIECRINAEDPDDNFSPCPGTITRLVLPSGPGVRLETHIYEGYEVPPFYDSLICKLVVWGKDRGMAIQRMERALSGFHVEGIKVTVPFHQDLFRDEEFISGMIDTRFVERFLDKRSTKSTVRMRS